MKKIILIAIIVIGILIPVFNFNYPWRLSDRFPDKKFNKLEVHEVYSKKSYLINNVESINLLYKYISKQRGYKHCSWFSNGLHGLSQGDENYTLIFTSQKEGEIVCLIIVNHKAYLSFTDGFYRLDSKSFNLKEFRKFLDKK